MKENVVKQKFFAFALRVVKLATYLQGEKKEFQGRHACQLISHFPFSIILRIRLV